MDRLTNRYLNISEISRMFDLSRQTIRHRIKSAALRPTHSDKNIHYYDMALVGPALFADLAKTP